MAYDQDLADRIRDLIEPGPYLTEKRMFGGLAFLIGGNMAITASGQGGILVRVAPARAAALLATTPATIAVMGGRQMRNWLRVTAGELADDERLAGWVREGIGYARSLPQKRP
ncbi:MAG TPA: TfoX/Sxy family protein [Streptosporangiaceae bacterium]|jgi:TfoX/Sxy family transcriptional regulator of competence genes